MSKDHQSKRPSKRSQHTYSTKHWLDVELKSAVTIAKTLSRVSGGRSSQVLELWPSGDFSIGNSSPPKKDKGANPLEGIVRRPMPWLSSDDDEYFNYMLESGARPYEISFLNRVEPTDYSNLTEKDLAYLLSLADQRQDFGLALRIGHIAAGRSPAPPMGLSEPTNFTATLAREKSKRQRPGLKGIASRGKRMLRSACALLDREYPRRCISFLTLTLPALVPDEIALVAEHFPKILDSYKKFLGRRLGKLASSIVYCIEIQEQRTKLLQGLPVLHVHFIFVGRPSESSDWLVTKETARNAWQRILESVVGRPLNCDYATRIEMPRGSLRREIGKYLSKGVKSLKTALGRGFTNLIPRQWWGCSRELSQKIRAQIRRFRDATTDNFVDFLPQLQKVGILKYQAIKIKRPITKSNGDPQINPSTGKRLYEEIVVGYSGYFLVENPLRFMVKTLDELKTAIQSHLEGEDLRRKGWRGTNVSGLCHVG